MSAPRVALLEFSAERTRETKALLTAAGCEVVATLPPESEGVRSIPRYQADLLMVSVTAPTGALFASLAAVQSLQHLPLVMMSADNDADAIRRSVEAGVCAYVVDGVQPDRLKPILVAAMARHRRMRKLSDELEKTQLQLSERKTIERAKGIIMAQRDVSEEQAYKLLRTTAMERNKRLADIAANIVEAADLLDTVTAPLSVGNGYLHKG